MEWAFAGGLLYVLQARPIVASSRSVAAKAPGAIKRIVERIKAFFT
jgi:hypothetical protein